MEDFYHLFIQELKDIYSAEKQLIKAMPDIIEVALAHKDKDKVRDSYNHAEFLQQRGEMMAWWSNHIESANLELKGVRNVAIEV